MSNSVVKTSAGVFIGTAGCAFAPLAVLLVMATGLVASVVGCGVLASIAH